MFEQRSASYRWRITGFKYLEVTANLFLIPMYYMLIAFPLIYQNTQDKQFKKRKSLF